MAIWALITGASEGLGREFAILAAKSGFDVILTARQEEKLQVLAHELERAYHIQTEVLPANLADPEAVEQLWLDASNGREIGVLVNNAGLGQNGAFADPEGWPREAASISVNIVAATILMKRAVEHMVAQGSGRILNISSTAAFMPGPNMAVYHASKAYFLSLSEAAATELRGSGVSVTVLCPGVTDTNFHAEADTVKATWINRLPMPSAESVAIVGWAAMEKGQRVKIPGAMNLFFAIGPRFVPRAFTSWVAGLLLKRRR